MTISKGFLLKRTVFSRHRLAVGVVLWIVYSYILYAFFYFFRESFRFFTSDFGNQALIVLDTDETFVYNLYYSSLAAAIAYGFSLRFVLQGVAFGRPFKSRSLIRRTLNEQGFFTWAFLAWFGRLATLLGICYLAFPIQYDIDFLEEFAILLFLLPFLVFYSTWPKLTQIIRGYRLRWMSISTTLFVAMSIGYAFGDFLAVETINKKLLKKSIEHTYGLQVPRTLTHQRLERLSLVTDVYIVRDTLDPFPPIFFVGDSKNRVRSDSVQHVLNLEREKLHCAEQSQMTINLHVDENIPMSFIDEFKYQLRKDSLMRVQYATGRKNSKYPSNYPLFKFEGIQQNLWPKHYPEFEAFLDSAERLDFSRYTIRLPKSGMYRLNTLKGTNRIEVYVGKDEITINRTPVTEDELAEIAYKFTKKYSPNYVIIFNADDQITFGRYIECLDLIYYQIEKLRNEMSLERYQQPFDYWYWQPELDSIRSKYPRSVWEWTREEKRLIEVMKKAGKTSF